MKSKQETKQLYGKEYVASFERQSPHRLARLLKYIELDDTMRVGDFACGSGRLMELVAPKVESYIGIDFSEPFIKAAHEKKEILSIENATFVCSDIAEFCCRNLNAFDVAFAMDFSEHVYDAEWTQILKSMRSSIKPGGRLFVHTPNAEFLVERMKRRNFILKQFPEHIAVRTPEHNVRILREAGFNVTHVWLIPHYSFLRFLHILSFIPVMGKHFKARILIEATVW